jgi:hypothetical protein
MQNTIVAGVLFTLKRIENRDCVDGRFNELQPTCGIEEESQAPYGADGAFMEASQLFNPLLLARLDDFYRDPLLKSYSSEHMINPVTKMPFGFEYMPAPAAAGGDEASGFHVFFDVNFSEEKITRLLQYLIDGFYIDEYR